MISWLYFLMSSLTFLLTVLRIYAYSIHCLSSPFSTISRRFFTRARVGDDILDFSGLLVALATLDVLCWIMSVMTLPMVFFFPFHLYVQFDVAHNHSVVTSNVSWLMSVTSATISGLLVRM